MTDEGRSEFKTQTGIDIEQDIDHVVACMGAPAGGAERTGLVVVTGRFDSKRIEAMALEHGGKAEQYKGKRLILVSPGGKDEGAGHGPEMAMGFLEARAVALGAADMVRLAVDRAASGKNLLTNAELMRLVGAMSGESMWAEPDNSLFCFWQLRYALPVLRSSDWRNGGWMRFACLPAGRRCASLDTVSKIT